MIQGACVYRDNYDIPVLKIYYEIDSGYILDVIYSSYKLNIYYTKSKLFTAMFPQKCIHILYKLPSYEYDINNFNSIYNMIIKWKNYIKPLLISY